MYGLMAKKLDINNCKKHKIVFMLSKLEYGVQLKSLIKTLKYLEKEISLADAIILSKRDTRRYVKRQLTWFRHNFNPDLILSI